MTYAASWPACSRHPHGTLNSAFPASPYILHPHAHSIRRLCVNSHSQLSEKYAPVLPQTQAPAVHQGSTVPVQHNSKDETCLGNDQVKPIRHRALCEENFVACNLRTCAVCRLHGAKYAVCRLHGAQSADCMVTFFFEISAKSQVFRENQLLDKLPNLKENNLCLFDNGYYSFSCL